MKPTKHSVALPHVRECVLTVATCLCGRRFGYDANSYDAAMADAVQHCEDELQADLEAQP